MIGFWSYSVTEELAQFPTTAPNLQAASDSGHSNTDDITANSQPNFDIICTEATNTITLYTDNPVANTAIGSHICTAAATETIATNVSLEYGSHNISYTAIKQTHETPHSPALAITITTGDCTNNADVDRDDVQCTIDIILSDGPPNGHGADSDQDDDVDIHDVVKTIGIILP